MTYWCASQQTRADVPDLNPTGTKGLSGQNLKNDGQVRVRFSHVASNLENIV